MDDLALIMYTSGTSGDPKGVMLTHGNLWWSAANIDQVFDTRRDDVHLGVAPMFHIGGINAFALRTLVRGGTVLVRRAFDPERTLRDLRDGGVSTVFGVPMMLAAVARCPGFRNADLSGVRAAIIAGAPAPVPLIAEYAERGMLLQQSWGMTETAPGGTYLPAARTLDKAGSVGLPLPYTRIRLVDPVDHRDVAEPGVAGEILVRGPNVSPGYWNDAAATRMALVDGWLRTGDLATRDADGYLWIVGRRCEVINSGGEKIYPVEVERALDGLPDVSEVAVLGIPDPTWGETVLAVLECPDGSRPTLERVREYGGRTIARYKLPTRIGSLPGLPRNQAGKVDKNRLRQQFGRAGST
jgi:fatty-acyl-CoA synthase